MTDHDPTDPTATTWSSAAGQLVAQPASPTVHPPLPAAAKSTTPLV